MSHHGYIVLPFALVSRCQILIFLFPAADGARRGTWHGSYAPTSHRRASDTRSAAGRAGSSEARKGFSFIRVSYSDEGALYLSRGLEGEPPAPVVVFGR